MTYCATSAPGRSGGGGAPLAEVEPVLINRERSVLFLVDVQAKLAPVLFEPDICIERCRTLLLAARRLEVPICASEQYPEGLGGTVEILRNDLLPEEVIPKVCFASPAEAEIAAALERLGREQIVVAGMEAHVCVLQTALDLQDRGYRPVVVADAVTSRRPFERDLGLARLRDAGVIIATAEMVLFEWLGRAGTADFKAVLPLIK